jgi:hypothetical protein
MNLFELGKGNTVIIKPATLLIKEFKDIVQRDSDSKKPEAIKELAYVYFTADYKSVYLSYASDERESVIIEDIFGTKSKWTPDEVVKRAVDKYRKLQETPSIRLVQSAHEAIEELINYYKAVDSAATDRMGRFKYDMTKVTKSIGDLSKVAESLDKLEIKIKRELQESVKARGGELSSLYEDTDF